MRCVACDALLRRPRRALDTRSDKGGRLLLEEEVVARRLLLFVLNGRELVDARAEVGRVTAERDLERREERVHASQQRLRRCCSSLNGRLPLKDDDAVGEVSRHDKVVLDDERRLLCVQYEALNDLRRDDTLFRVQEAVEQTDQRENLVESKMVRTSWARR